MFWVCIFFGPAALAQVLANTMLFYIIACSTFILFICSYRETTTTTRQIIAENLHVQDISKWCMREPTKLDVHTTIASK